MERINLDERVRFLYGKIEGRTGKVLEIDRCGHIDKYLVYIDGMEPLWCFRQEFARLEVHSE